MQPNGANLTGGGTGTDTSSSAAETTSTNPYVPFNGQGSGAGGLLDMPRVVPATLFGALLAVAGIFARL